MVEGAPTGKVGEPKVVGDALTGWGYVFTGGVGQDRDCGTRPDGNRGDTCGRSMSTRDCWTGFGDNTGGSKEDGMAYLLEKWDDDRCSVQEISLGVRF